MNVQKINNAYNGKNQNFKGAYRITIPKSAFYGEESDEIAQFVFNNILCRAIKKIPRNFKEKLVYMLGLKPEAIDFFKYPGYEHFNAARGERSMSWLNQHMQSRYGLDFNIPETEKEYHTFFLLTKKEADAFVKAEKGIPKRVRDAVIDVLATQQERGMAAEKSEIPILTRTITGSLQNNTFRDICEAINEVDDRHVENLDELTDLLDSKVKS